VVTYSVGQVRVAELVVSYYGVQRLTHDNIGNDVYGRSDILAVRGGFGDLAKLDLAEKPKLAVAQARACDAAAIECFPGLLASRRNYEYRESGVAIMCGIRTRRTHRRIGT
jgi:hypothetical protein